MKLLKNKLVPAALIAALLFSTPVSSVNAASDLDFSYMLKKVAEIDDPVKKQLGIDLFKTYIDNDDPDVEGLKKALKMATDSATEKQIKDAGYSLGDVLSKLDVIEDMNNSEINTIISAMENNDFTSTAIKKIAEKYDDIEDGGSSGSSGGSSGSGGAAASSNGTVIATTPVAGQNMLQFKDVQSHWAKDTIADLYSKGVIKGQTEDSFNPDGGITRAEFTALIVRALGIEGTGTEEFTDVNPSDWFYSVVTAAKSSGIINGITQSSFAPNEKVTREQMVKIIIGALEYKGRQIEGTGSVGNYADSSQVSSWAADSMAKALGAGIIKGQSASSIAPKAGATRAEAATVISRIIK